MSINNVAKLLATFLYVATVTAWDPNDSQMKSLSSQIDNTKSFLNQLNSPPYKNNYGYNLPWDQNVNRNTDYEAYIRQQYVLPILNSLNDISDQILSITKANSHQQPINVPFPIFYPPKSNFGDIDKPSSFNSGFGGVSGWGTSQPSFGHSQSPSSGSSSSNVASSNRPFSNDFSSSFSSSGGQSFVSGDSSGPLGFDSRPAVPARFPDMPERYPAVPDRFPAMPASFPATSNRLPEEYDANQNWGFVEEKPDNDNVRPVSLKPTAPPPQECNCEEQNKNVTSLALRLKLKNAEANPVTCKSVILLCCVPGYTEDHRKECFSAQGCPRSYSTGIACLPVVIQAVYKDLYGNL